MTNYILHHNLIKGLTEEELIDLRWAISVRLDGIAQAKRNELLPSEITELLVGRHVHAIKLYKDRTGVSLALAKGAVDAQREIFRSLGIMS